MQSLLLMLIALGLSGCAHSPADPQKAAHSDFRIRGQIFLPDGRTPLANTKIVLRDLDGPRFSFAPSVGPSFQSTITTSDGSFAFVGVTSKAYDKACERNSLGVSIESDRGGNFAGLLAINPHARERYVLNPIR